MPGYSLTDNEFKAIEALISYSPERGRKPTKVREMFDGILCPSVFRRSVEGFAEVSTLHIKASTIASVITKSTACWSRWPGRC